MRACDPRTKRRIRRAGPAGRYRDGAAFRDCARRISRGAVRRPSASSLRSHRTSHTTKHRDTHKHHVTGRPAAQGGREDARARAHEQR
jgi:hypothetical protein